MSLWPLCRVWNTNALLCTCHYELYGLIFAKIQPLKNQFFLNEKVNAQLNELREKEREEGYNILKVDKEKFMIVQRSPNLGM